MLSGATAPANLSLDSPGISGPNMSLQPPDSLPSTQSVSSIGGFVGAGMQILNALLGFVMQKDQQRYNERQTADARRYALEQWQRENAYNSPSAQIARLKAAGLNPALIYGNGIMNEANSSPNLPEPIPSPRLGVDFTGGLDPLTASQVELNLAQARKLDTDADDVSVTRPYRLSVLERQSDVMAQQLRNMTLEAERMGIDLKVQNETVDAQISAMIKELSARGAQADYTEAEAKERLSYLSQVVKTEYDTLVQALANKKQEFENLKKQGRLTDKQIAAADVAIRKSEQELENLKTLGEGYSMDNQLKSLDVTKQEREKKFYYVDKIFGYYERFASVQNSALSAIGSIIPF